MLRRLRALLALGAWVATGPALAREPSPLDQRLAQADVEAGTPQESEPAEPALQEQQAPASSEATPPPAPEAKAAEPDEGWRIFATGYFRAPLAMGFSPRKSPDDPAG